MVRGSGHKVSDEYVSQIPDISSEMESILEILGPSIADFHSRCKGSSAAIGLLFSEMAKHPLPPQVIDSLLGLDESTSELRPQRASARQFREALCKIYVTGETAMGFHAALSRHIKRMETAHATTMALHELLTTFHTRSEGTITALGSLLGDLGPSAIQGKPLPRGMANALLHANAKATSYELPALISLFEICLSTEDSPALIAPILNKHIGLANINPQAQLNNRTNGAEAHEPMDTEAWPVADCPLPPRVLWCARAESNALHDSEDARG